MSLAKDILASLKERLEEDRERATKELRVFAKRNPHLSGDWNTVFPKYDHPAGYDENVNETEMYQNLLPVEHTLELRLRDIDDAIQKMKRGRYGVCEQCSADIELPRLQAKPEARLCIGCRAKEGEKDG